MTSIKSFVQSVGFSRAVIFMIVFSSVLLGLETSPEIMNQYGPQLKWIDRFVISFFFVETILKILSFGKKPHLYFKDTWNVIDFLIVLGCLIPSSSSAVAVFRLIRVLRVLRLITALPKLQIIISALLKSVPSMTYVAMILGIHFYMFGVLGTFLFSANDPVHFGSLGKTFLSLFQVLTLEGWADLLRIQVMGCAQFGYDSYPGMCTGSIAQPISATLFFIAFIVLGTMIILNLLIGVVVNGMSESHQEIEKSVNPVPAINSSEDARTTESLLQEVRALREDLKSIKNQLLIRRD